MRNDSLIETRLGSNQCAPLGIHWQYALWDGIICRAFFGGVQPPARLGDMLVGFVPIAVRRKDTDDDLEHTQAGHFLAKGTAAQFSFRFPGVVPGTASWRGPHLAVPRVDHDPAAQGTVTLVTQCQGTGVSVGARKAEYYLLGIHNASTTDVWFHLEGACSKGTQSCHPSRTAVLTLRRYTNHWRCPICTSTDEQGSIVAAAALRNVGKAAVDNVSPLVSLIPSEGQVLHELSIPTGVVGRDLFDSLNQWEVQVDEAGASALVPCTCAQSDDRARCHSLRDHRVATLARRYAVRTVTPR